MNKHMSISIPSERTAFVFGKQVAQAACELEASFFPPIRDGDRPEFSIAIRALSQQIEVWPNRSEVAQLVGFLNENMKPRRNVPEHTTDL